MGSRLLSLSLCDAAEVHTSRPSFLRPSLPLNLSRVPLEACTRSAMSSSLFLQELRLDCSVSPLFSFLCLSMSHLMCAVRTATLTTGRSCSDPVESHAAWSLSLRGSGRAVTPSSRTPPLSFSFSRSSGFPPPSFSAVLRFSATSSFRGSRVLRLPQVLGFSCSRGFSGSPAPRVAFGDHVSMSSPDSR